ncbi:MAG: DUF2341 domain-containing protein [archaeon]
MKRAKASRKAKNKMRAWPERRATVATARPMLFTAICIMLFLLSSAPLLGENPPTEKRLYLSVEKPSFSIGESIMLIITGDSLSDYEMVLSSASTNYKYNGELKNNIAFYPREAGVHRAELISKLTKQPIDSLEFMVGSSAASESQANTSDQDQTSNPSGTASESGESEPSGSPVIVLNKQRYLLGEQVNVSIRIALEEQQDYRLYYEYEGLSQRYMGDFSAISFAPLGIGTHHLVLKSSDNAIIAQSSFEVSEAIASIKNDIKDEKDNASAKIQGDEAFLKRVLNVRDSSGTKETFYVSMIRKAPAESPIEPTTKKTGLSGNGTDLTNSTRNNSIDQNTTAAYDLYDLELTITGKAVSRITLNNLRLSNDSNISMGIDDVPLEKASSAKMRAVKAFAIDPSHLDFTDGSATLIATGRELWKCKDWSFDSQSCAGSWSKVMELTPGQEYSIALSPEDPGYAETGVASINTRKSTYHPGESAEIIIVVLDNQGRLTSDASVELAITLPDNQSNLFSTSAGTLSSEQKGIFTATFDQTGKEGDYIMVVNALGANVNSTMISSFTVSSYYEFDIIRDAPVVIDPWQGPFTSRIRLISFVANSSNQSFDLVEVMPASFNITDSGGGTESIANNTKQLRWYGLTNDSEVSYSVQAPLVTPELYNLGQSMVIYDAIGSNGTNGSSATFTEARPWYLAADPAFVGSFFMLWDNTSNAPSGWTCVSCVAGDPFYSRLIRGDPSYGSTGGQTGHSHTIAYQSETLGDPIIYASSGGTSGGARASGGHTHEGIDATTTGTASNFPSFRQLKVIAYTNGLPSAIPTGAIGIFNTTSLPADWTRYSAEDGYFILGNGTSNVTGGSNNHSHSISITTSTSSGTSTARTGGTQLPVGASGHTHTATGNTNTTENIPLYVDVILAKATTNTAIPYGQGFIGMFNSSVGDGWVNMSQSGQPFYHMMIRANNVSGATGGNNQSTHANTTVTTGAPGTGNTRSGSGRNFSDPSHTHEIGISFNTTSHLPSYINVVFGYANSTPPSVPTINTTQCYSPGFGWINCTTLAFNSNFTSVRTRCTSNNGVLINNVSFIFINQEDNKTFFNVTTTDNSTGYWTYDIDDILIQDSGSMNLSVICRDSMESNQTISWSIPWGTLSSSLINPTSNRNVSQNKFFNFTARIACSGGECGYIKATLDPETMWWNRSWKNRKQVYINTTNLLPARYTVETNMSTTGNGFLSNNNDVRVVYWNGTANIEIDRHILNNNTANATIFFAIQSNISAGTTNNTAYYIYYNNSAASTPPKNLSRILVYAADFESGTESWTVAGQSYTWERASDLLGASVTGCRGSDCDEPARAISGDYAWGTNIGGIYPNDASTWGYVQSTAMDLSAYAAENLTLSYFKAWQLEGASYDYARIRISNSSAFTTATTIETFNPATGCDATCPYYDWSTTKANVSAYDTNLYIRFEMQTDTGWQWTGLYFDFITVRINTSSAPAVGIGAAQSEIKGAVPVGSGTPFYTTNANPMYAVDNDCLGNMMPGSSCNTTWMVNATGNINSTWTFFATYESENYSSYVSQSATSSINITILDMVPPSISNIQCYKIGTGWTACSNILFNSNLTDIRAQCSSGEGANITNVTFTLSNKDDNKTIFDVVTTDNSTGYWYYNLTDTIIQDSGDMNLSVTCTDADGGVGVSKVDWSIPWGTLSAFLINPTTNINVTRNRFFNFTAKINCSDGECGSINASALRNTSIFGSGKDGALTVSAANSIINNYTYLTANASNGTTVISVNSAAELSVGDEILIIQMQNFSGGTAGVYEFATIISISSNNLTLNSSIQNTYRIGTLNTTNATATQVVRVPQYSNLTINTGASVTAPAWNGYRGGIVAFKATGIVNVSGIINTSNLGYKGGLGIAASGGPQYAYQGESFNGLGSAANAANLGGGGGGYNDLGGGGLSGASGGGGGYASVGDAGDTSPEGQSGGSGGITYGNSQLSQLHLGSGGAGGGSDNNGAIDGTDGTRGGGIIFIKANSLIVSGAIESDGQESTGASNQWAGSGGAGSGGSVYLSSNSMSIGSSLVSSTGGIGGCGDTGRCGGDGGNGRIRLDFIGISGSPASSAAYNGTLNETIFLLISTASGDTPLFTNAANPMYATNNSCLGNMIAGRSCNTTWSINATGETYSSWMIFASYSSLNLSWLKVNTSRVNITIIPNLAPSVTSVVIVPDRPRFDQDLNCTFTVSDPNLEDSLSANVSWFRDGALVSSALVSVTQNVSKVETLGYGNLTAGEVWWCGITPSDGLLSGNQVNSSNVTILASMPPDVSNIECQRNRAIWVSCPSMAFNQNITAVRAICSDTDGYVVNATFSLSNIEDSKTFFTDTTTDNSSGYFTLDNPDITITDSGIFNLSVSCMDNNDTEGYGNSTWLVPWGTLIASLVDPSADANVTRNRFFNFTAMINCSGGECGYINATLDPTNWWNSSWGYRITIALSEMANRNLSLYQFKVNISTQALIGAGKMNADCSDIRFISNTSKQLDYWIESGCNTTGTIIWVVNNLSAKANTTMNMYYGNPDAGAQSNATKTMFLYEDMSSAPGGSLTGNATYIDATWGVRLTVAANDLLGYLYYIKNPGVGFYGYYETWAGGGSGADATWIGVHDNSASSAREDVVDGGYHFTVDEYGTNGNNGRIAFTKSTVDNGAPIASWTNNNLDDSAWHTLEVYFYNNGTTANAELYYDGVLRVNGTDSSPQSTSGNYMSFAGRTGGETNQHYIRKIIIRKYVDPEPTVTLGDEVQQTKGIIPMGNGTPFYTITANPMYAANNSCLGNMNMASENSCNTTWEVNATGNTGIPWEFFVTYSSLNYSSYVTINITRRINITIVNNTAPRVSAILLTPEYPLPTEDLNCTFTVSDSNLGDSLSANITWYLNNTAYSSVNLSVGNGVSQSVILGFGNISLGQIWHCGATPSDGEVFGAQVNSSNVTVVLSKPPVINQVQCYINGSTWTNCSKLSFKSNLSGVRVNCTTSYMPIWNVTINFTNTPDSTLFFTNTTNISSGGWWTVYRNVTINDSGEFVVGVTCTNNESAKDTEAVNWTVPWGKITLTLINPNSDGYVEYERFFNFTAQVNCILGECGDINAMLDPETEETKQHIASFLPTKYEIRKSVAAFPEQSPGTETPSMETKTMASAAYAAYATYDASAGAKTGNGGNRAYPDGMVTINSMRPSYDIGEAAELVGTVLDSRGNFVPSADLRMIITSPSSQRSIFTSSDLKELAPGLYELTYDLSRESGIEPGIYSVEFISAGEIKDSMGTAFEVKNIKDCSGFEITRDAPFAVNPWAGADGPFDISITAARRDSALPERFTLTETVPLALDIIDSGGADHWISEQEQKQYLIWSGLGDNSRVSYRVSAPKISPERYGLRAAISAGGKTFKEPRSWFIAVDPASYYSASNDTVEYYISAGTYTGADGGSYANTAAKDCSGGTCTQSNAWVTGFINMNTIDVTCRLNTSLMFNISNIKSEYINNITVSWGGCWHGDQVLTNDRCDNLTRPEFSSGTGGGTFDMWMQHNTTFESMSCIDTAGGECGSADEISLGTATTSPAWGNAHGYNTFTFRKADLDSSYVNNSIITLLWRTWGAGVCANAANDEVLFALDYANLTVNWNYLIKNGSMVSIVEGSDPFYTVDANPMNKTNNSCLSAMRVGGGGCNVTWRVNATGGINTTHIFYVIANTSVYPTTVMPNESIHIMLTIRDTSKLPPTVTLNSPENNFATTNTTVIFNCSATDNSGLTNMTLYINVSGSFEENGTNDIGGVSNSTLFNRTYFEGRFLWNCKAMDIDSNERFATTNRTLIIDHTSPYIVLSSPQDSDNFSSSNVTFRFTVFDNVAMTLNCNITIDDSVRDLNFTVYAESPNARNIFNISQGDHFWNVSCADNAGNWNISETRNFTLLNTPPTVVLQTMDGYTTNSGDVELFYLPSDNSNIVLADLYINGSWYRNETVVDNGITNSFSLFGFSEGRYNWTVNVTDDGGFTAQAPAKWFIIDKTGPSINLAYPDDNYSTNSSSAVINFTVIDNYDQTLICIIIVNGTNATSYFSAGNNTPISKTVYGLKDGLNYWNVSCTDDATNTNVSETRRINVSAPPTVVLNTPADNYSQASGNISLNYTPADNVGLLNCTLILNGQRNQTNSTINNTVQNRFFLTSLPSSDYNWSINCTDTAGLVGYSTTRIFRIDSTAPTITLNRPQNNDTVYGGFAIFNWTAYDNLDPVLMCNLTLDGALNKTNIPSPNGQSVNVTVLIPNETSHLWNVTCADDSGNRNTSEMWNFSSVNAPTVTLIFPKANEILNFSQNINFTYIPGSSNSLSIARLFLNGNLNQTTPNPNRSVENYFFLNLSDGIYNWSVSITDNMSLNGSSETRFFRVDSTPPIVTVITPYQGQTVNDNDVTFSFNVTDNLGGYVNCTIYFGGEPEWSNISTSSGSTITRYKTLFDGSYNWSVNCTDVANNTNAYQLINFTVDAPPNVTINFPPPNYRTRDTNISFNYTPLDPIGFNNCSLYINGSWIQNSSNVARNVPNFLNTTGLNEGAYIWNIECFDQEPDFNNYTTPPRNFTIDLTGPNMSLLYPGAGDYLNSNTVQFNWTATDYAGVSLNCSLFINETFNRSLAQQSGSYFTPTVNNMSDGSYDWYVNCSDDLNNSALSETRVFTINKADLYINDSRITFNNTNPDVNQTINITANVSNIGGMPAYNVVVSFWDGDPGSGGTWIGNSTATVNYASSARFSVLWNISGAMHTIYAIADPGSLIAELDESNNNATTTISPLYSTITYPAQNMTFNSNNVTVNFTVYDYNGSTLSYTLFANGTTVGSGSTTDGEPQSVPVTINDGTWIIKVGVTDALGRKKNSTGVTIYVDGTPPSISYFTPPTPINNWVQSNTTVTINVSHYDVHPNQIILYWQGAANETRTYTGSFSNFTLSGLTDGIYNYYVWLNDTYGLSNQTATQIVRIDLSNPVINLEAPAPGATVNSSVVEFDFNVTDSSQYVNCSLYINGTLNKSRSNLLTNTQQFIVQQFNEGTYTWSINCTDQLGRSNISDTISFTVPTFNPNWTNRWYEQYNTNVLNTTAMINLMPSRDGGENRVNISIPADSLYTMAIAYSPYIAGYGATVPNGTNVSFSGLFSVVDVNDIIAGYVTWKVYLSNESGDFLIAQVGNDDNTNTGGNKLDAKDTRILLGVSMITNRSWLFTPTDRVKLVVNMYSDDRVVERYIHYWDNRVESWVDFSNFSVIGAMSLNMTEPSTDITVAPDETFNQTCLVNCTYGTCINVYVYAQNNATLPNETGWSNMTNSSGNIRLAAGQSNGVFLSNITGLSYVNFTLNGSVASIDNVRCYAKSDYNDAYSMSRQVSVADLIPPNVTLTSPRNSTYWNAVNMTFYFNTTENVQLRNCTLLIDGNEVTTKNTSGLVRIGSNNLTAIGLAEGLYNWSVICSDISGSQGNSSVWWIGIDRTAPEITLNYPAPGDNFPNTTVILNFTATDSLDQSLTCNLTLDGSINRSNFEAQNGTWTNVTVSGLTEGAHSWNVTCWDNASNTNTSETRSFSTFISPRLTLVSPLNNSISNNATQMFLFNVSDDTGLTNCSLLLNGVANTTKTTADLTNNATNNFTATGMNGTYLWAVTCFDNTTLTMSNTTAPWNLTIDLEPPMPIITTPSLSWFNTSSPTIQFNITDNVAYSINYTFFVNGTVNTNGSMNNNTPSSAILTGLVPDGEYAIMLQAVDRAGNIANSTTITIYVDTAKPGINLSSPENGLEIDSTSVRFNFTATDNMASYMMCNLTVSNGIREDNINASSGALQSIFKSGFLSGTYFWNVSCIDLARNRNTSVTWNFTINSPDLIINSGNISFNESTTEEGKNITIFANVYNQGGTPAYNVTVQFWRGDPDAGGTQINGNRSVSIINANDNITLNITYLTIIGNNNIFVVVDPPTATNGSIVEEDESNNKANNSLRVSLYHVFAGNTTGMIRIEKQSINNSLYIWNVSNYTGSNIYVTDLEASPNFLRLQAMGTNTSNTSTTGDFADIDTKLGTTNFTDSINITYTSNGAPRATKAFTVFSKTISDVPIINSTNSSTFQTGILWDTNDGGVEYNGTQDIIFITETNQQQEGLNGVYDFEIKVPALLRNYNAGGSSVAFYAELK